MGIRGGIIILIVLIFIFIFTANGGINLNSFTTNPLDTFNLTPYLSADDRAKLLPTNGFELPYAPMKWNTPPMMFYHNCYDYAFNNYDLFQRETSQPGYLPKTGFNESGALLRCAAVNERLENDHGEEIIVAGRDTVCPANTYKIALVVDPDDDYHFIRQNRDGTWSHKPGSGLATNKDFAGKIIIDPETADFKNDKYNYSNMCNYFCVPRGIKKNF